MSATCQTHSADGQEAEVVLELQTVGGTTVLIHVFAVVSHEQNLLTVTSLQSVSFLYELQSISLQTPPAPSAVFGLVHTHLASALHVVASPLFPHGWTTTFAVVLAPQENEVQVHLLNSAVLVVS